MEIKPGTEKLAFISPFEDTRKSRLTIGTLDTEPSSSYLDWGIETQEESEDRLSDRRRTTRGSKDLDLDLVAIIAGACIPME